MKVQRIALSTVSRPRWIAPSTTVSDPLADVCRVYLFCWVPPWIEGCILSSMFLSLRARLIKATHSASFSSREGVIPCVLGDEKDESMLGALLELWKPNLSWPAWRYEDSLRLTPFYLPWYSANQIKKAYISKSQTIEKASTFKAKASGCQETTLDILKFLAEANKSIEAQSACWKMRMKTLWSNFSLSRCFCVCSIYKDEYSDWHKNRRKPKYVVKKG